MGSSGVELAPHATTTVGFTVRVPAVAGPGDHLGAVVASTKTTTKPGSLSVESRVALIVRVRIPGVARMDGIVGLLRASKGGGGRRFSVEVRNTGNLLFTVAGRIDITQGRQTVAVVRVEPKEIYIIPNGVARFEGVWESTPLFGKRKAAGLFKLTAFGQQDATRRSNTLSLSFSSWLIILILLIILFGVTVALLARRRWADGPKDPGTDELATMSVGAKTSESAEDRDARSDSREWYS
jgi:hypothetical protein